MRLPYTLEVFFVSMERYNREVAPVTVAATAAILVAFGLAAWPRARGATWSARVLAGVLGLCWCAVGALHQLGHMAKLDFLAPVYGVAWITEGVLLIVAGTVVGGLRFALGNRLTRVVGSGLVLLGAVAYPLAVVLSGYSAASAPLPGTAPGPTAIVTSGFLVAARGPRWLRVALSTMPVAWGGVAAASAYLLSFWLELAVTAAALIAIAFAFAPRPVTSRAPYPLNPGRPTPG
jgi:hypothetical protein